MDRMCGEQDGAAGSHGVPPRPGRHGVVVAGLLLVVLIGWLSGCQTMSPQRAAQRVQELQQQQQAQARAQAEEMTRRAHEERLRTDPAYVAHVRRNFSVSDRHAGSEVVVALRYNDMCAERVAVHAQVNPSPPAGYRLPQRTEALMAIAEQVQSRCSEARHIRVRCDGMCDSPATTHQGPGHVMLERRTGWTVASAGLFAEILGPASSAAPGTPTLPPEVVSFDAQFPLRFGERVRQRLEGVMRLEADHRYSGLTFVEGGAMPVRFSGRFTLSPRPDDAVPWLPAWTGNGYWYGHGDQPRADERNRCNQPREGHAYWGSFTISGANGFQITMGHCDGEEIKVGDAEVKGLERGTTGALVWNPHASYHGQPLSLWLRNFNRQADERSFYARFSPPPMTPVPPDPVKAAERERREQKARDAARSRL